MRKIVFTLLAFTAMKVFASPAATPSRISVSGVQTFIPQSKLYDDILWGIAQVETGNRPWRVGQAGERSQFQIKLEVWRQHSILPFEIASSSTSAAQREVLRVAHKHMHLIHQRLVASGRPTTVSNMALLWTSGVNAGRFPARKLDYAKRVSNLVRAYRNPVATR